MKIENISADCSCLIFKWETEKDGFAGIIEIWSDRKVEVGTEIRAKQSLDFRLQKDSYERFPVRDWVVTTIIENRDFKGQWTHDRERKNKNSYWKLRVAPYVEQEEPTKS